MISYTLKNYDKLFGALAEHLELVGITLLISVLLACAVYLVLSRFPLLQKVMLLLLLLAYCIPSIALFAFLVPVLGLGKGTAVVGMTIYNLFLLLRSIQTAEHAVPADIYEAARGIGLSGMQSMRLVYLPVMLPYLITGIRIVTVSTTGIATMAGLINAGGLGNILFEGMRTYHMPKLIWGILMVSGLAMLLNFLFIKLENRAVRYAQGKSGVWTKKPKRDDKILSL